MRFAQGRFESAVGFLSLLTFAAAGCENKQNGDGVGVVGQILDIQMPFPTCEARSASPSTRQSAFTWAVVFERGPQVRLEPRPIGLDGGGFQEPLLGAHLSTVAQPTVEQIAHQHGWSPGTVADSASSGRRKAVIAAASQPSHVRCAR